jgi:hypothetical protein
MLTFAVGELEEPACEDRGTVAASNPFLPVMAANDRGQ